MPQSALNFGDRFEMFGVQHFGALAAIAIATFVTCWVIRASCRGRLPSPWRVLICRANAVALLAYALLGEIYWIQVGWSVQASLPFHLCDLSLFVTAAALWVHSSSSNFDTSTSYANANNDGTSSAGSNIASADIAGASNVHGTSEVLLRSTSPIGTSEARLRSNSPTTERTDSASFSAAQACFNGNAIPADPPVTRGMLNCHGLFEIAYYWGLGGTVQALLTPELTDPFPTLSYLKFFAGHGLIIVGVFALACGLRLRPRPWSPVRVWLATNVLVPPMLLFNWLTGSNYMYLCGPPATASIMDYFGPWPLSLLTLEAVGLALMGVLYVPYLLHRARIQPPMSTHTSK